ncbi:Ataxin-7-like protein 1 [Plecturocebus cupreus]
MVAFTHSLSHRRAVPGRKKQFDLLLAEHKAKSREKEVKDKEHLLTSTREILPNQSGPAQDSLPGSSGSSGPEPKVASPAKSRPPNSVLPRPSSANSISSSASSNHSGHTPEPPLPPVGVDLASRLSSDEGEMDGADEPEKLDCQFSTHHPRPLAVAKTKRCLQLLSLKEIRGSPESQTLEHVKTFVQMTGCQATVDSLNSGCGAAVCPECFADSNGKAMNFCSFGSRLMGRGYYVFDRRWDRFRFALNSMVEKHLNSQMWKQLRHLRPLSGSLKSFQT